MFCKMMLQHRKIKAGSVPVYLNVYDLTPMNGYAYWVGLGIYHSGVQEPKQCPGFTFRKSILIGRTDLGPKEVRSMMQKLAKEYSGNTYHLITKNCNHFCNDACLKLTGKAIPSWVNRLARLGFLCNCVLPAELNGAKVRQVRSVDRMQKVEKKKLRSRSSRFPSSATTTTPTLPTSSSTGSGIRSRAGLSSS
ncbi:DeSI-like protein At4g17486 [Linum perenne]